MPRALTRLLAALFTAFPFAAQAACPAGSTPVLSCTLSGGNKVLDVCLDGETLTYAFGKAGKPPDLSLAVHVLDAGYAPWNGIGRSIYEEVGFRNADVTYTVWFALDRLAAGNPLSGGIEVSRGANSLASLQCDEGSATAGFFELGDRMEELGQCWDYELHQWGRCN